MKTPGIRLRAGAFRGRVVPVPPGVRPTEGRVREAFFDIAGPGIAGCRFLDLFAGSGALGVEALSRGAAAVVQVDSAPAVVRRLQGTRDALSLEGVEIVRAELPRGVAALAGRAPFDWIFADPPYDFAGYEALLLGLPPLLAADGVAVLEHDARRALPEQVGPLGHFDQRRYGDCALSFYRYSASDGSEAAPR